MLVVFLSNIFFRIHHGYCDPDDHHDCHDHDDHHGCHDHDDHRGRHDHDDHPVFKFIIMIMSLILCW